MFKVFSSALKNKSVANKFAQMFSGPVVKKPKMELTIRTPYATILDKFEGFQRVLTKTNEAALIIQNRTPPSVYVLPPGHLKVKLNAEVKQTSGDLMHLGGWAIVHV